MAIKLSYVHRTDEGGERDRRRARPLNGEWQVDAKQLHGGDRKGFRADIFSMGAAAAAPVGECLGI